MQCEFQLTFWKKYKFRSSLAVELQDLNIFMHGLDSAYNHSCGVQSCVKNDYVNFLITKYFLFWKFLNIALLNSFISSFFLFAFSYLKSQNWSKMLSFFLWCIHKLFFKEKNAFLERIGNISRACRPDVNLKYSFIV